MNETLPEHAKVYWPHLFSSVAGWSACLNCGTDFQRWVERGKRGCDKPSKPAIIIYRESK